VRLSPPSGVPVEHAAEEIEGVTQPLESYPHLVPALIWIFEAVPPLQQPIIGLGQRARREPSKSLVEAGDVLSRFAEIFGVRELAEVD
jgi:hypothetical protein